MSGSAVPLSLVQTVEQEWPVTVNSQYAALASTVILFYDYLLTSPLEMSEIWSAKLNGPVLLYYMNRYPFLISQIAYVLLNFAHVTGNGCNALSRIYSIILIVQEIACTSIFILRTFALYRKSLYILAFICFFGTAYISTSFGVAVVASGASPAPYQVGPLICQSASSKLITSWNTANVAVNVVFDTIIFGLTWLKTARSAYRMKKWHMKGNAITLFFRDGTIYYLPIFIMAILSIYLLDDTHVPPNTASILRPFTHVFPNILVNRMVLNLLASRSQVDDLSFKVGLTAPSTFNRESWLGNFGGSLNRYSMESVDSTDSDETLQGSVDESKLKAEDEEIAISVLRRVDFNADQ